MDEGGYRTVTKIVFCLEVGGDKATIVGESKGSETSKLQMNAAEAFKAMSEAILRSKLCTINGDETETTYQDWLKGKMK